MVEFQKDNVMEELAKFQELIDQLDGKFQTEPKLIRRVVDNVSPFLELETFS